MDRTEYCKTKSTHCSGFALKLKQLQIKPIFGKESKLCIPLYQMFQIITS